MEDESVDINYKKGFNHGYLLSSDDGKKYLDELIKGINNKESTYYKALLDGKKQYKKDKIIEQLKHIQDNSKGKEIER